MQTCICMYVCMLLCVGVGVCPTASVMCVCVKSLLSDFSKLYISALPLQYLDRK